MPHFFNFQIRYTVRLMRSSRSVVLQRSVASIPSKDSTKSPRAPKHVSATQSCPTLCEPMDCSPPGFSVHGILQTKILEWVATPFSRGSSWPRSPALQADSLPSEPLENLPLGSGRCQLGHSLQETYMEKIYSGFWPKTTVSHFRFTIKSLGNY